MEVLRNVQGYCLNIGSGMASELYNISDSKTNVSLWGDDEFKDKLMKMSNDEFIEACKKEIEHAKTYNN